jgi:hypothetical protein
MLCNINRKEWWKKEGCAGGPNYNLLLRSLNLFVIGKNGNLLEIENNNLLEIY